MSKQIQNKNLSINASSSTTLPTTLQNFNRDLKRSDSTVMRPEYLVTEIDKQSYKKLARRNSKQISIEQQFSLPDNFEVRILQLEDDLEHKLMNGEKLVELIHLYSVF